MAILSSALPMPHGQDPPLEHATEGQAGTWPIEPRSPGTHFQAGRNLCPEPKSQRKRRELAARRRNNVFAGDVRCVPTWDPLPEAV